MKHSIFNVAVFVFLFTSCVSCGNNRKIESTMKNMINRRVDLSGLVPILSEKYDSSSLTIDTDHSAKLVLYLDSSSCSTCVINKLGQYDFFQKKSKDSNGRFILIFVFSVPNGKFNYIQNYVINHKFEYPIFFDKENQFKTKNNFIPKNIFFHSFLLDKNNQIILVGNPVVNDSMWKLYVKTIENLLIEQ